MLCDKCSNYQPCLSRQNEGYFTACKNYLEKVRIVNRLTNEEIQLIMNGKKKTCKGFEKL